MNISFVKLGHEECETCVEIEEHRKVGSGTECGDTCTLCSGYEKHLEYAKIARMEYRKDGDEATADELVMAVDLQKVHNNYFYYL